MKRELTLLVAIASLAACSKGEKSGAEDTSGASAASTAPGGEVKPGPGGKVIVVEATTDEKGNYYTPNEIEAHKEMCFASRSSWACTTSIFCRIRIPGRPGSPLRARCSSYRVKRVDIPVNFAAGKYYFQCDPHAALGMKGHLEVEDESH